MRFHPAFATPLLCLLMAVAGCQTKPKATPEAPVFVEPPVPPPDAGTGIKQPAPSTNEAPAVTIPATPRIGDEIVVAGKFFHTGTRIVLWSDTNGYNAYNLHNHFTPAATANQAPDFPRNRYEPRKQAKTIESLTRAGTNTWDLPSLQKHVDQFVIHYDAAGTSRHCFYILHDRRFLSVHFLLDLDGTIYQTLDAQERASHATISNDRSIGIEIANIGAYPPGNTETLDQWYDHDTNGQPRVTLPERFSDGGILTPNFIARPARMDAITNTVQGQTLVQYDFTPEQYAALAHLTAALCRALPQIKCDAPRHTAGKVRNEKLPDEELEKFQGILGHYHIQSNKTDPGPAFDWQKVISEAQQLMSKTNSTPGQSP